MGLEKGKVRGHTSNFLRWQNEIKWDTRSSMGWEKRHVARPPLMGMPPVLVSPLSVWFASILCP
jgi:hypothetical protein